MMVRIISMKKDGRSLDHVTLEYIRKTALERIDAGESVSAVMQGFNMCRTTAYKWLDARDVGGPDALNASIHPGPPCKLTDAQKQQVRKWICGKDPRQFGIDFGLWTRNIVQTLIRERMKITISLATVGKILAELNITPQKPLQRAYQRDPIAVAHWKTTAYPSIKLQAKREKGTIFFLDEAGFSTDDSRGRTWGMKGQTPVIVTDGRRQRVNAISAVSPTGGFWSQVYDGKLSSALFVEFLTDFCRSQPGILHLIIDSLPAHKSKLVQEFLDKNKEHLRLHFLPTYAPDLNPDELVWHYMKSRGTTKRPLKFKESLKKRVISDLKSIKRNKALVKSLFLAKSVDYTAA